MDKQRPDEYSALADYVLYETLKPLFAHAKNPAITSQGRKALARQRPRYDEDDTYEERKTKPWKFEKRYLLTTFRWTLQHMTVGFNFVDLPLGCLQTEPEKKRN